MIITAVIQDGAFFGVLVAPVTTVRAGIREKSCHDMLRVGGFETLGVGRRQCKILIDQLHSKLDLDIPASRSSASFDSKRCTIDIIIQTIYVQYALSRPMDSISQSSNHPLHFDPSYT